MYLEWTANILPNVFLFFQHVRSIPAYCATFIVACLRQSFALTFHVFLRRWNECLLPAGFYYMWCADKQNFCLCHVGMYVLPFTLCPLNSPTCDGEADSLSHRVWSSAVVLLLGALVINAKDYRAFLTLYCYKCLSYELQTRCVSGQKSACYNPLRVHFSCINCFLASSWLPGANLH